jgi:integrase
MMPHANRDQGGKSVAEGIERRVQKDGTASYRASVWSARDGKRIRQTFPTLAAARAWRRDAQVAVRNGRMRPTTDQGPTITEAAERWLDLARAGQVRNHSGEVYKPASIRNYERCLRLRVLPALGDRRLDDLRRAVVQRFVDDLVAAGLASSTIGATVNALAAIYRRAVARGDVEVNPTRELELPAVRSEPRRVATPEHAERLLGLLGCAHRALWGTAIYAGLRRGELTALRWGDVDLAGGVIRVEHGWDRVEGEIAPKSRQGRRAVPIPAPLRDILIEHRMGADAQAVRVFRSSGWVEYASEKARETWRAHNLDPVITLHEGRHTYATMMIAAGVNAKALCTFMGHANISVTFDVYGKLFAGSEAEAAGLLEAFLSARAARAADDAVPPTVPQVSSSPC